MNSAIFDLCFSNEGILVYHVNAAMHKIEGNVYYDIYNRNTDPSHPQGTENNLVEFVLNNYSFAFGVGETMTGVIDDYGNELMYSFIVDALSEEYATITFQKNKG